MRALKVLGCVMALAAVAGMAFAAGPLVLPKAAGAGMNLKFVLVSHGSSGDPFHSVVKQGMEDAAALFGVQAEILMSEGDNAKEVALVEQALAGNPDGIGISIVDPVAFDDVIQKAITKGIPVIAFNNDDANTPNARLAYIGAAERKVGYVLGRYMQQFLKKGDKIVIPEEVPGMSYAVNRSAGIIDAMKEIGVTAEELDRLCLEHIARYKRPRRYVFVEDLPKNNYGKVLKTALRERL